ncbi:MAG: DUF1385 domain-containing protein [bacterium]|nr:DUF1385 domain-containing protein [candidate division KSB1 bacterium]MDH7561394.1 DUF1385 domain-containing protein [bacterium]
MNSEQTQVPSVGGQAVIEGVMMRAPGAVAVAVRRPDGSIVYRLRPFRSLTERSKLWGAALLRGGVVLVESLLLGVEALTFSSRVAMGEDGQAEFGKQTLWNRLLTVLTFGVAVAIGLGLFFYLPLLVAHLTGVRSGLLFNLIDGVVRLGLFVAYLLAISQWKEIRRVFEYHGAEHMSIHAYQQGGELSVEEASRHGQAHARCGTSFLLVVVMVSVLVFVMLPRPRSPLDPLVVVRLLLVPLIAGLSYELLRLGAKWPRNFLLRPLVAVGMWLQGLTTRVPDRGQLEVALVALRSALGQDVSAVATAYADGGEEPARSAA